MENNIKLSAKSLALVGMFSALIAVFSQISIPLPAGVPITLQTLGIALCGYILGWKLGIFSIGAYILLGSIGIPVFANFKSGINILFGMTGGFIWGFIFMTLICGIAKKYNNKFLCISLGIIGLLICHLLGVLQFSLLSGNSIKQSIIVASLPFIIKDIVSIIIAYFISININKKLKSIY